MTMFRMPKPPKRLYLLCKDLDANYFRTKCDDALASGWEPLGGVSIAVIAREDRLSGEAYVFMYAQAFIKDFYEEKI